MTAPRLDLGELRRLHEAAPHENAVVQKNSLNDDTGVLVTHVHKGPFDSRVGVECPACQKLAAAWNALPALLSIAEAAEAYVSMVEQMPDASLGHQGNLSKVMGGYKALRAAVRKEEKDE